MSCNKLFLKIDSMKKRAGELLSSLIRIKTEVPPGNNYQAFCQRLAELLSPLGFVSELIETPLPHTHSALSKLEGPRLNLVSRGYLGQGPPLSIYAHIDTVPAGGEWTIDPFAGEIRGDRVYGRGAVDMKGSIAALLVALEAMKDIGLRPLWEIHALFCSDEEVGINPGVTHLARRGYLRSPLLWLEGGAQLPMIIIAGAGILQFEITVKGKSCHAGASYLGVNAVEEAIPLLGELLSLKKKVEAFSSRIPSFPGNKAPSKTMVPLFNINIVQGGEKENMVPDLCRIVIDRRLLPDEDELKARKEVRDAVTRASKRGGALVIEMEELLVYPPFEIDPNTSGAEKARRALSLIHGYPPDSFQAGGLSFSSEIGLLQRIVPGLEVVGMGLLSQDTLGKAHAPDEYVTFRDLLGLAKQIAYFLCCD